jgi:pilus assembly protein CpaE
MGRNTQVLVVDADADHRASLRRALGQRAIAVVGEAQYGVEASRLATALQPDVVLVHLREPLALTLRTLEAVQAAAPQATPIVVSRMSDAEIVQKAMLAGARAFIASPVVAETMESTIVSARERHRAQLDRALGTWGTGSPPTAGSILTVFGPKGGVGKTTLSSNLALSIAKQTTAPVVLVDGDVQFGDVALSMGLESQRTLADVLEAMARGERPNLKEYLLRHPAGVEVLAARHRHQLSAPADPEAVASILRELAQSFDFVVVDTPGTYSSAVAAALDESTTVFLVTSADMASVKDARMAVESLRGEGFDGDRLKLVVNHATNANSVTDADIARTVGCEIFWTFPHDRAVPISTQRGEPLVLADPQAKVAKRIQEMAAVIGGAHEEGDDGGALFGLFRRGK